MVSSSDFVRAPERSTAISTLNRQRHLTPSCGGFTPTAERTVGPARISLESLTPRPGIREHPDPELENGLRIDPIALGQRPQALLTILYCSTDCLCRCGAAVKNLSHSASFHSRENKAPSNRGIKHLGRTTLNRLGTQPYHISRCFLPYRLVFKYHNTGDPFGTIEPIFLSLPNEIGFHPTSEAGAPTHQQGVDGGVPRCAYKPTYSSVARPRA